VPGSKAVPRSCSEARTSLTWGPCEPTGRCRCRRRGQNSENPYEYVEIRGRVAERTHDGADESIDALAKKYLDADVYPFRNPGEQRVIIRVEPEYVKVMGG
jgi:hypothetical protein